MPKWPFSDIFTDSPNLQHSPSNLEKLARLADIHQAVWQVLARLADICQRPFFEKNMTRLAKFGKVMSGSGEWCVSGHCLINSNIS
jgi:hypothetical protein